MGRLILVALLASVVFAGAAGAHGGATIATASNDAYKLTVQALDMRLDDGRPAVDLTAYPVRRSNGAPDLQATVTFTLGGREYTGRRDADGITAEIPIEKTGAWKQHPITATVDGSAGTITARADAQPASDSGPPAALVPATIAAVLALGAVVVIRRRSSAARP